MCVCLTATNETCELATRKALLSLQCEQNKNPTAPCGSMAFSVQQMESPLWFWVCLFWGGWGGAAIQAVATEVPLRNCNC